MTTENTIVKLKQGREKPAAHGHPWVFSGAIEEVQGPWEIGRVANVVSHNGTWLARGLAYPGAGLVIRLYTWDEAETIDDTLFAERIDQAVRMRSSVIPEDATDTNAYRLFFSEADGISGLVVDRYADTLVVQVGAQVLVPYLPGIKAHLMEATGLKTILFAAERNAVEREGLDKASVESLSSVTPGAVEILQGGHRFQADLAEGQKTGFFLDQRINRRRVAAYAKGRSVLSAYCYTGAFDIYAAAAGASSIVGIDTSITALTLAEQQFATNAITTLHEYVRGDVTKVLRSYRDAARTFGLIILDPPRFVANRGQLAKGLRAYKDANLWALKLLEPGGVLATFSCSGLVSAEAFTEAVRWAASDAGRKIKVLEVLSQPPDHPADPFIPESSYLKGLICWVK